MALTQRKHFFADFTQEPVPIIVADGGEAVGTGADNQVDWFQLQRPGHFLRMDQVGANSALNFAAEAEGWLIPCDATDGDAIELHPACSLTAAMGGPMQFTIGTDPAFFIRAVYEVGTVARFDVLHTGFRILAAHADVTTPATMNAYTDLAAVGIHTAAGALYTATELNNGGLTATALAKTAVTDGQYLAVEVDVSSAGAVTYKVGVSTTAALALADLAADASAVAFTFDSADVVIPAIWYVSTGTASDSHINRLEVGYQ